jgi:hypothetical protein
MPTIFVAASFCSISGILAPFPSRILLLPLLQWLRAEAHNIYQRLGDTFTKSTALQTAVADSSIQWLLESSRFLMSAVDEHGGLFSWGTTSKMQRLFTGLPHAIQAEILPDDPNRIGTQNEADSHANPIPTTDGDAPEAGSRTQLRSAVHGQQRDPTGPVSTPHSDLNGPQPNSTHVRWSTPPKVNTIVMPHALSLLKAFNPRQWASKLQATTRFIAAKRYNVENLLWAQIIVLDITIRLITRDCRVEQLDKPEPTIAGGLERQETSTLPEDQIFKRRIMGGPWGLPEVNLVTAITKGWMLEDPDEKDASDTQPSRSTIPLPIRWNLASDLEEHSQINFGGDPKTTSKRFKELEDLLKIRALFVVALFMLGPDSSDVYLAENSDIEMPMI